MTPAQLAAFFDGLESWAQAREVPAATLRYGDHADQVVDVYGDGAARDALLVVLHGGFWRPEYTRRSTRALAVALAETGFACANVEYRRLGPGSYEPLFEDLGRARKRLGAFDRVVAIGHSAGGQLALWLAAEDAVDAAVALGGVCDLREAFAADLGAGAVAELLGGSPEEAPEAYALADPGARLPLGRRQVLVHGTRDDRVPIEHARGYAARARSAGDDVLLVEVDADHFQPIDPRSDVWPSVIAAVTALTQSPIGASAP